MKEKIQKITLTALVAFSIIIAQTDTVTEQSQIEETNVQKDESAKKDDETKEKLAELKGKLNGLEESYLETKGTVDKLKKIKISGYIQAQMRSAVQYDEATDTNKSSNDYGKYKYNVGDFAGGTFNARIGNQFQIRRGRIKASYETDLTQGVIQLDVIPFTRSNVLETHRNKDTIKVLDSISGKYKQVYNDSVTSRAVYSSGGITLKDVYLRFTEPYLKSISVKAGFFDRPFGFEIMYSSSSRESPERSRIFQTLFPNERDLGVSLEYLPSDNLPLIAQYFNARAGLFTGNGINVENNGKKDIIGRLGFSVPLTNLNLSIDGGFSGYLGYVELLGSSVNSFNTDSLKFVKDASYKRYDFVERQYLGGDLQLYYDIPVIGGISLRGEYIQGQQPGSSSSSSSPSSDIASTSSINLRNFSGFYGMLVQNVWKYNQLVLKYDSYDPNTDVKGDDIKSNVELAYSTFGIGLIHHWDENVKLIAYYDKVMNETSKGITTTVYHKDLADDVFTFRIQYKF